MGFQSGQGWLGQAQSVLPFGYCFLLGHEGKEQGEKGAQTPK